MTNPTGLCGCGCGGTTKLAPKTESRKGWVKGEPLSYLRGHSAWKDDPRPLWKEGPAPPDRPDLGPCWIWQRFLDQRGYGRTSFSRYGRRPNELAHRALYEMNVGPIPDGLELDHLCFNPACVRWEAAPGAPSGHLEVVTGLVNQYRARSTKLHDGDLALALLLRAKGMRWRAIAEKLGVTHPPLINRLKQYCKQHGLEYPASESTRPRL